MRAIDADSLTDVYTIYDDYGDKHTVIDASDITDAPTLNAIVIPENATNLDMIKALFPNTEVVNKGFHNVTLSFGSLRNQMFNNYYDEDWLNEPYKGGR